MRKSKREIAALYGVNVRTLSDSIYILKHGSPEMIAAIESGRMNNQEALRQLGRASQNDRNRKKTETVLRLCEAVLDGDSETAKQLAAEIVVAHSRRNGKDQ